MCRRVTCSRCGKASFAGCGMHVEQVLGNVPRDQRCRCREEESRTLADAAQDEPKPKRRPWRWPL